jgi:hypothetical protein
MGIYWTSVICHGFYLHRPSQVDIDEHWCIKDRIGVLVFIPHTLYKIRSLEPVIERCEVEQGYVNMTDVQNMYNLSDNYFNITPKEDEELSELASKYSASVKTWIVEYTWDTYTTKNELYMTKILPVKSL